MLADQDMCKKMSNVTSVIMCSKEKWTICNIINHNMVDFQHIWSIESSTCVISVLQLTQLMLGYICINGRIIMSKEKLISQRHPGKIFSVSNSTHANARCQPIRALPSLQLSCCGAHYRYRDAVLQYCIYLKLTFIFWSQMALTSKVLIRRKYSWYSSRIEISWQSKITSWWKERISTH